MKAILLAAGRGSRLGELTQNNPKPLTPLLGKPLLEWQLQAMRLAGLEDVTLVTGYQHQTLEHYGTRQIFNPRWNSSNMVRSLMSATEHLHQDTCLVSYGDIVYRPDHLQVLMRSAGDISLTYDQNWLPLWSARFDDPLSDAESFRLEKNRLVDIGQKPRHTSDIQGQYMGLLKFTPTGWQATEDWLHTCDNDLLDKLDMTSLLRHLIGQGLAIEAIPVQGGWVEVDNLSDLTLYESLAIENNWSHDWR